jgi:hypothetical protein
MISIQPENGTSYDGTAALNTYSVVLQAAPLRNHFGKAWLIRKLVIGLNRKFPRSCAAGFFHVEGPRRGHGRLMRRR